MATDLIALYEPHEWTVYTVEISGELQELDTRIDQEGCILRSCGSDSEYAQDYYRRTGTIAGLFFFDVEQVFMDLDRCYGELRRGTLKEAWRDHPTGSLVFVVAKGVDVGCFTVGIAPPQA